MRKGFRDGNLILKNHHLALWALLLLKEENKIVLYPYTFKGLAKSVRVYIMDIMSGENKNLKDTSKDYIKDTSSVSTSLANPWQDSNPHYIKSNKLITALYMVTDTMDKEEPIRLKLRTLGVEILSDIISLSKGTSENVSGRIAEILSFLNIANDIGMVSKMNCSILIKEFTGLKQSIQELKTESHLWLEEFIKTSASDEGRTSTKMEEDRPSLSLNKGQSTRIGVQKGSTLMQALDKVEGAKSTNFDVIKKERRESIINIIKACPSSGGDKPSGVSIKDISSSLLAQGQNTGKKTLQRELVSMVKDNVLKKTGEKRWSQYFLN